MCSILFHDFWVHNYFSIINQIAAARDESSCNFLLAMADSQGKPYLANCKYDLSTLPSEEDEDYIDMGSAILCFYSTLVDLLGRCAPSDETIKVGTLYTLK